MKLNKMPQSFLNENIETIEFKLAIICALPFPRIGISIFLIFGYWM